MKSPGRWQGLPNCDRRLTSTLTEVECLRTLDRARVLREESEERLLIRHEDYRAYISMFDLVELDSGILRRAAEPLPVALRTLDAIHLATAKCWEEEQDMKVLFVTHDQSLGRAARLMGLEVTGIRS